MGSWEAPRGVRVEAEPPADLGLGPQAQRLPLRVCFGDPGMGRPECLLGCELRVRHGSVRAERSGVTLMLRWSGTLMSVYFGVFKKLPILDHSDLQKKVAKIIPRIPSVPSCTQRAFLPALLLGHASSVSSLLTLTPCRPSW